MIGRGRAELLGAGGQLGWRLGQGDPTGFRGTGTGTGAQRSRQQRRRAECGAEQRRTPFHESASLSRLVPPGAFCTMGCRLVIDPTLERLRTILLGNHSGGVVMGVDVALPVPQAGGALVMGVAQVGRDLLIGAGADVGLGPAERHDHGVGLRCPRR